MKYAFIVVFLFFNTGFSEETGIIKVIYKKSYVSSEFHEKNSFFRNIEYTLIFSNAEGIFKFEEKLQNDGDRINRRAIGIGGGKGIYYKNIKKKEKIHQFEFSGEQLLISYPINQYSWNIKKETKQILGKICYKATAEYKEETKAFGEKIIHLTAWFTPDIPVSFGPAGYDGLPGLVMEVTIGNLKFYADSIKTVSTSEFSIERPVEGRKMTHTESLEYLDKLYKKISN